MLQLVDVGRVGEGRGGGGGGWGGGGDLNLKGDSTINNFTVKLKLVMYSYILAGHCTVVPTL